MAERLYETLDIPIPALEKIEQASDKHEQALNEVRAKDIYPVLWSDEYNRVWTWLTRTYTGYEVFPPPLNIDHRRAVAKTTVNDDGSKSTHVLGASMNWLFDRLGDPVNSAIPVDYNCTVYHHSMLKVVGKEFHSQIPIRGLVTMVRHDLLHELMHFATCYKLWKPLGVSWDVDTNAKALDTFSEWFTEKMGGLEDEYNNEVATLQLLWDMEVFYSSCLGGVIHGGPYDMFKRDHDPEWRAMAYTYDFLFCKFLDMFGKTDDPEDNDRCIHAIIKELRSMARKENKRFKLMD